MTDFKNESRVLKETNSMLKYGIVNKIFIASLHESGLEEEVLYNEKLILNRFKLSTRKFSKNIFFQAIKYIEFLIRVIFFYKNKNINIINIHSVSLLPIGVLFKYIYGAKLVYDTHELETEVTGSRGIRKKLSKIMERSLIKKSDLMFVVSDSISDWYTREYNIRRPEVVLNVPKLFKQESTKHFRKKFDIDEDSVIVLYQGALMEGRGIELLLESFILRNNDKIVIVFMGYGPLEEKVKSASSENNNIFFHDAVPPEVVLEYTASADFGISFIENTCLSYYYCLPNKLFEYAMVGLPVIVSKMKEMEDIVNKYNMGIVVEKSNAEAINNAIDTVLKTNLTQMKENARKCAEENSWEKQEIKMINEYKRILDGK
jgi:glycosyltransferase involved in cell wall biosynthesis